MSEKLTNQEIEMKKTMYLIEYSSGRYEDFRTYQIFVTENREFAENYCYKFNNLVRKWKEILRDITNNDTEFKDNWAFNRVYEVMEIHNCVFYEISVR